MTKDQGTGDYDNPISKITNVQNTSRVTSGDKLEEGENLDSFVTIENYKEYNLESGYNNDWNENGNKDKINSKGFKREQKEDAELVTFSLGKY